MTPLDPLSPDADQARRLLADELAKPEYLDPGNWLRDELQRLLEWITRGPDTHSALSDPQLVAIVLGVVALVAVVGWAVMGPVRAERRRRAVPVLSEEDRTAAELRVDAERLAALGDWGPATLQLYRALVRGLGERGVISESPGMTAHEAAGRAAERLPGLADGLEAGAAVFDGLAYGDRPGSRQQYDTIASLLDAAAAARPGRAPVAAEVAP
jgi:hypothetical protein